MRSIALVLALSCAPPAVASAQVRPAPPRTAPATAAAGPAVTVSTRVNRTAVWVGDRIEYVVEFRSAPNVEILTDDLNPDRLKIEGLEVLDVATERDESTPGRIIHRVRYRLVTYQVEQADLTIAEAPVRFAVRQPGQRPEDAAPAGEITVPALVLAFRSTLPASNETIAVRDDRSPRPLLRIQRLARPAGLVLVLLSIAPAALWGADLVRRARRSWATRPRHQPLRERRAALESIRMLPSASPADRRAAYARLDAWVRDQLRVPASMTASALTPSEVAGVLAHPPSSIDPEGVHQLLVECEQAKYAPEPPDEDRWPAALERAELLLGARSR